MIHPTIGEVAEALETWAPLPSALSYDNPGLQVGDARRTVATGLVALDLTAEVVAEAISLGAELVVTHHPLIFQKLRSVTAGAGPSGLAFQLASRGIALYSTHTNLDAAWGGVSFALAEQLGLHEVRFLKPSEETLLKLVTFVPPSHEGAVRTALGEAGAGHIGRYRDCSFTVAGTGHFRPESGARAFTGTPEGSLEATPEIRLEMEVARWNLPEVLRALRAAHPYEEVAYDVYPVLQQSTRTGLGAIGILPEPMTTATFLDHVCQRLETTGVRFAGRDGATISRVAVCGGAGSDLARDAMRAGADAYVTADVTYHKFFDVLREDGTAGMLYVDAGHYETESITEVLLCNWLSARFPKVAWHRTSARTSPVRIHTR